MRILHKPFHKGDKNNPAKAKPLKIIEIRYTDGTIKRDGKIIKPQKKESNKKDKYKL